MTTARPTIGLALIAKDEEETLPHLLASIEGAFDQVAVLDTGSTDRTVEVFEEWSAAEKARQPAFVGTLGNFEWCDDFAAARNAAEELLDTEWWATADCDDLIEGARRLRRLLAYNTPPWVDHWRFRYERGREEGMRPRLRRAGAGVWIGRIHEGVRGLHSPTSGGVCVDIQWASDRGGMRPESRERDLRVLRSWTEEEPRNLRPLGMLAVAEFEDGNREDALDCFGRYIELRYAQAEGGADWSEKTCAEWALEKLTAAVRDLPAGPHYWDTLDFAQTIILSRRGVFGAAITCAENRHNPEPAHEPGYSTAPKTRQQRRAEARRRAKVPAR